MPTSAPNRGGRPPKPAALRRDFWVRSRVNELELAAAQARASAAGLELSEYVRLQVCGAAPEQTAARSREAERQQVAEARAPGDRTAIEEQIRREQPGLPARSVKMLAARRLGRGG